MLSSLDFTNNCCCIGGNERYLLTAFFSAISEHDEVDGEDSLDGTVIERILGVLGIAVTIVIFIGREPDVFLCS